MGYGSLKSDEVEFTRPANTTAYAANDAVSDSASAPTVLTFADVARTSGGAGYVTGVRVITDKPSITPTIRLHLFNNTVTAINDNAAFTEPSYANRLKYVGFVDVGPLITNGAADESYQQDMTVRLPYTSSSSQALYGLVQTLDAFTPDSAQKFSITIYTDNV